MSVGTTIEWTDATWSPTTGCDRVSPGCDHCYALTLSARLKAMGSPKYQTDGDPRTSGPGFGVAVHPGALTLPLTWRKPRRVFVDAMSDLFHAQVPREFIAQVFAVMALTPQHTYQILTKRPGRMRSLLSDYMAGGRNVWDAAQAIEMPHGQHKPDTRWPLPNVWLGVSVENQHYADTRIPELLRTPAAVRFLSCEPLLEGIDLARWLMEDGIGNQQPDGLHWVICGGESGPGARPMHIYWARALKDQCEAADIPFFFKQWGAWAPTCAHDRRATHIVWPDGSRGPVSSVSHLSPRALAEADALWIANVGKKRAGRELDGRTWDQMPVGA